MKRLSTGTISILIVTSLTMTILFFVYISTVFVAGVPYIYSRQREAMQGKDGVAWSQNIGGSLSDYAVSVFDDPLNNDIVVFGNTMSSDFDFDIDGGFVALLTSEGATVDIVSLGAYGISNIVSVIRIPDQYIILHDDGVNGQNVSITQLSLDLFSISSPSDVPFGVAVPRYANQVIYNYDTSAPLLFVIYTEQSSSIFNQIIIVTVFDLTTQTFTYQSKIDGSYSLEYLDAYLYDERNILIFASELSQGNYIDLASITLSVGGTPTITSYSSSTIDYRPITVTPTANGYFYIAATTISKNATTEQFIVITIDPLDENGRFTYDEFNRSGLVSAKFIPTPTGFYLLASFANTSSTMYQQSGNSTITEVKGFENLVSLDDFMYVDYYNSPKVIIAGKSATGIYVAVLIGGSIQYTQTIGGTTRDGESNAMLLVSTNKTNWSTITVVCNTTSASLGKPDGDIPSNFGGTDVAIMRLDSRKI